MIARAPASPFAAVFVVTLGDALLDVVVRLDEPLESGGDARAHTRAGAGGQAANVAVWAVELGARARLVSRRADDEAGRIVEEELARRGVELSGPVVPGRTGVVVSLVAADGERTMASDRGVASGLAESEIDAAWVAGADVLHVSGYSLAVDPAAEAALAAGRAARTAGARVSVDLSAASVIRSCGPERFGARLAELDPDVVFANEDERAALGDVRLSGELVLKRGPRGIVAGGRELHALAADVVDSTGAGDALAAGFLIGGPELALEAAARCVARVGAMP